MVYYLLNIFLMFFWGLIFLTDKRRKSKIIFCVLCSSQWILLSGLRHISIGADTAIYEKYFYSRVYTSWSKLFDWFVKVIIYGGEGKDPGYNIIEKLFQLFVVDYQSYLIFIAAAFTIPLGVWIYRNSKEPLMSFLIYSILFYSFFSITGHRQTIATSLVIFIGYEFIKKRKLIPFLILIFVAFTIHKSSLYFLPFYFISQIKISKLYLLVSFVLIPFMFIFNKEIFIEIGKLGGYIEYTGVKNDAGSTYTFTAMLIFFLIITFWRYEKLIAQNPDAKHFINALVIAVLFTPLTYINLNAMRLVQYFSIFLVLLIPEIIRSFDKPERAIANFAASTALISIFISNSYAHKYLFFWE